jgi:hypothetical protein
MLAPVDHVDTRDLTSSVITQGICARPLFCSGNMMVGTMIADVLSMMENY